MFNFQLSCEQLFKYSKQKGQDRLSLKVLLFSHSTMKRGFAVSELLMNKYNLCISYTWSLTYNHLEHSLLYCGQDYFDLSGTTKLCVTADTEPEEYYTYYYFKITSSYNTLQNFPTRCSLAYMISSLWYAYFLLTMVARGQIVTKELQLNCLLFNRDLVL